MKTNDFLQVRFSRMLAWVLVLAPVPLAAETLVQSNVDTRLVLAYKVDPVSLQSHMPAGWAVAAIAAGPMKNANLVLTCVDRLLAQAPDGKPMAGGIERQVLFTVPARNNQSGESATFVLRAYTANPDQIPGPYKTSLLARVAFHTESSGSDTGFDEAIQSCIARSETGVLVEARIAYRRALPSRSRVEARPRSPVDPKFYRVYRIDQGSDQIMSVETGRNAIKSMSVRVADPMFARAFDGSETLVGAAHVPWYVRQVYLPD
jgi:hypothetical protein